MKVIALVFLLVTIVAIETEATPQCPFSHPYVFFSGSKCCKSPRESYSTSVGNCNGRGITIDSFCCEFGKETLCPKYPQESCRNYIPQYCSSNHPYAFSNGDWCCKSQRACDGGEISRTSLCCGDKYYAKCAQGNCFNNMDTYVKEKGWCKHSKGKNSGTVLQGVVDGVATDKQKSCLFRCLTSPVFYRATGCELSSDNTCRIHTEENLRGSGSAGEFCWIFKKPKENKPEPKFVFIKTGQYHKELAETYVKEKGWCLTSNGKDQNSGTRNRGSVSGDSTTRQLSCLAKCLSYKGATACELSTGGACVVHTEDVGKGSGYEGYFCWIFKEKIAEKGWCLTSNGKDQNSGTYNEGSVSGDSTTRQESCLAKCLKFKGATACELSTAGDCVVHTEDVGKGSGYEGYFCWIFKKPKVEVNYVKEEGWCLTSNGEDQNSGTHNEGSVGGDSTTRQQTCLAKCRNVIGATACELSTAGDCVVHTEDVGKGSGDKGYFCWIFKKPIV